MLLLEERDVLHVFPTEAHSKTVLVLKSPKTEASNRIVYLPPSLKRSLFEWQNEQKKSAIGELPRLIFTYEDNRPLQGGDEFQEWGRRTWNELYTGLKEDSISLEIEKFSSDEIDIQEKISLESVEDIEIIVQNISRVFDRQYSLYKTTFRDGQYTAKRDFSLTKTMKFTLPKNGAQTREIIIKYGLPKSDASYFNIDLSHVGTSKEEYKEKIESKISKQMYYRDLKID